MTSTIHYSPQRFGFLYVSILREICVTKVVTSYYSLQGFKNIKIFFLHTYIIENLFDDDADI